MSSINQVNFSTRPNKSVTRKVVFETLTKLNMIFEFAKYRYIGFGSMWFSDFIYAHKQLLISDLISIEKNESLVKRAEFNKPYACVKVEYGESTLILPKIPIREKHVLVWLDYCSTVDEDVLKDISTVCQNALTGSVIIVTINADKKTLSNLDSDGQEFEDLRNRLHYHAGDLIPQTLPPKVGQASKYPKFLASILFNHMKREINSAGRENDSLFPMLNICYRDGAPMIVVGAVIADNSYIKRINDTVDSWNDFWSMSEDKQLDISVPPLTLKEKSSLDQLMPCIDVPSGDQVSELGFNLKPSEISNYHKFYQHYPVFGEIIV